MYDYTLHALEKATQHWISLLEIKDIMNNSRGRTIERSERHPSQLRYRKGSITVVVDYHREKVITCWRHNYLDVYDDNSW